jgi:16S rRNA (guanine527-N7)-methyltransferase
MSVDTPHEIQALSEAFRTKVRWTPEAQTMLVSLRGYLDRANREMNLVGASTLETYWTRHIIDSAQLLWFEPDARVWADIGSGAGFPGLVLGVLLRNVPGANVHLVESMAKRCRFLRDVVHKFNLPCDVHEARAESLALTVEVVTARACAPLDRLLGYVQPFFARGARGLFLKGEGAESEIAAARSHWRFDAAVKTSMSDPRGRIVSIGRLGRVGKP